jgi:hypothetical protein
MNAPRRADRLRNASAAGGAWGPSLLFLAVAVGLVLGALASWLDSAPPDASVADASGAPPQTLTMELAENSAPEAAPPVEAEASAALPAQPLAAPPAATLRVTRTRDPDGDQTPDLADYINEGEQATMADVIHRLRQAGVHTGLAAFSPPGTRPPLVGLAVPEDFPLPEGYVRHHQATDDGQRIETILMFSPDRQFFDAAGQPIAVPKDRVVPPEFAPPGLPARRIVIPAPIETGRR